MPPPTSTERLSSMLPNQDKNFADKMEGYRDGFANGNKSYENSLHRTQESSAANESNHILKISLRIPATIITTAVIALSLPLVFAQAPVNDVVSWPPGLLLLATVLYATLGTSPNQLWEIEPVTGVFLFTGLPKLSIRGMQRVNWVTSACHFVPGIRSAFGRANFW
ncbi:hypothetical protein K443DRAFT_7167, partial [Laccaria amethystina LaAM-08-1]